MTADEPARLGELLPDVVEQLAETCATERIRNRHTQEDDR